MGFRDKTYVIFDGDNDLYAYGFMKGWKKNEKVDFDFEDAHDLNVIRATSVEDTVKKKLRERFEQTRQACVLIGKSTKNLFQFVRWEIEVAQEKDIPIIAINLNDHRGLDKELCPPILLNKPVMHVAFRAAIIKYALDDFCPRYYSYYTKGTDWIYRDNIYARLGL